MLLTQNERTDKMRFVHAEYNMYHNSIDINTYEGYILRIDCNVAEKGLKPLPVCNVL